LSAAANTDNNKMAAGGAWRRPRMKVYDYNQEFGGNYYQPMIQYINKKDIYGPFHKRTDVYLPHSAEVTSDKYTNMRYQDKSSAKHNLDEFLQNAYSKQIKELNGTTAAVHYNQLHGSKGPTPFSDRFLLGSHLSNDKLRRHYTRELGLIKVQEDAREKEEYSASFLDEIRERNRLDRLRRACRTELESDWLLDAGPQVDPVYLEPIHPDILSADADPLSYDQRSRVEAARNSLYNSY